MGVKDIYFINSRRVDENYWSSPKVTCDSCDKLVTEGLEQARDTIVPKLHFEKRFKPFAEDILPVISKGKITTVFHPTDSHTDKFAP
jgi:16S rRNA (uracil1498-N3)-methyltransferase